MRTKITEYVRANLVGCLALVVALTGTAYAAATVGSRQVVNNSLRSIDLRDNAAVRSVDVQDDGRPGGGLRGSDIREGTLRGLNADRLDGLDSQEFAKSADGFLFLEAAPEDQGSYEEVITTSLGTLSARCLLDAEGTNLGEVTLLWSGPSRAVEIFVDSGATAPAQSGSDTMNASTPQPVAQGVDFQIWHVSAYEVDSLVVLVSSSTHDPPQGACIFRAQVID